MSLQVNSIGEPDAANLHVRFDERGAETERWSGLRHRHVAKAAGHTTAPDLIPPRRPSTLPRQPRANSGDRLVTLYCCYSRAAAARADWLTSPSVIPFFFHLGRFSSSVWSCEASSALHHPERSEGVGVYPERASRVGRSDFFSHSSPRMCRMRSATCCRRPTAVIPARGCRARNPGFWTSVHSGCKSCHSGFIDSINLIFPCASCA